MKVTKDTESGQSLVEFALVIPILLLLFIAIINFGEALAASLMVQNIARNGARAASLGDTTTQVTQQIEDDLRQNSFLAAVGCGSSTSTCPNASPVQSITTSQSTSSNESNTTTASQTIVTVKVRYGIQLWGPVTSAVLGNPYIFHASVSMIEE